ncbi:MULTISPECIES: thymidine kinase [Mesotoga]|uniref:thymidine kinase n=1 Tax=Mesotoga TaxID=1184396 RepID=UPI0002CA9812|nr:MULTISPECIES: thymidine kinase [Mesotoga]MCP5456283.1 thymidine kinase [Thermotogota bacterium]CCU85547.1 Thymidine kinase [Mesotoga infera]MCP5461413.1 thymidine kinase [Thermotogota bacterium]HNQ71051.1 thymidine kinase [Mesotoga prima]HNS75590.1 thymidine kinase [Mesotoga prima]
MSGKLTVVVGPMYSGKTSTLLSMIEIYTLGKKRIKVFKPVIDDRYSSDHVVSHSGQMAEAINVYDSSEIKEIVSKEKGRLDAIFIDEINFFDENLLRIVEEIIFSGVDVFCVGLDLSYKHRPFAVTANLMAAADEVIKKKAVCHICGEYNATVTHRISGPTDSEIDIGGMEKYIAVCRDCYKKLNAKDWG